MKINIEYEDYKHFITDVMYSYDGTFEFMDPLGDWIECDMMTTAGSNFLTYHNYKTKKLRVGKKS